MKVFLHSYCLKDNCVHWVKSWPQWSPCLHDCSNVDPRWTLFCSHIHSCLLHILKSATADTDTSSQSGSTKLYWMLPDRRAGHGPGFLSTSDRAGIIGFNFRAMLAQLTFPLLKPHAPKPACLELGVLPLTTISTGLSCLLPQTQRPKGRSWTCLNCQSWGSAPQSCLLQMLKFSNRKLLPC